MREKFEDIIDIYGNITLEKTESGTIEADWETVESKIQENPDKGKWAKYIQQWKAEGRI